MSRRTARWESQSRDPIRDYLRDVKRQEREALVWKALAWVLIIASAVFAVLGAWSMLAFLFSL